MLKYFANFQLAREPAANFPNADYNAAGLVLICVIDTA